MTTEQSLDKLLPIKTALESASARDLFREIVLILQKSDGVGRPKPDHDVCASARSHFHNKMQCSGYKFTKAWETPAPVDLSSMNELKATLQSKLEQVDLDHAMQYFATIASDYPGEYFLQPPFLFDVSLFASSLVNEIHCHASTESFASTDH